VFPVDGHASFGTTHSGYPASDIFADCGTPVVAVTAGRVLEVSRVDRYDADGVQGPNNGGLSVSVLGDDGVRYYGSHLSRLASGIDAGVRVRAGQRLGAVGRTGNANNVCHLHFGLSPRCAGTGDWWTRRGVVWPAKFLRAWRAGENRSPAAAVRAAGCADEP
jgi:murein DD-endopeptidase MepM/ murein hydrolase activator NlpD